MRAKNLSDAHQFAIEARQFPAVVEVDVYERPDKPGSNRMNGDVVVMCAKRSFYFAFPASGPYSPGAMMDRLRDALTPAPKPQRKK